MLIDIETYSRPPAPVLARRQVPGRRSAYGTCLVLAQLEAASAFPGRVGASRTPGYPASLDAGTLDPREDRVVLCLHLVNTGVDVDHHSPRRRRDQSFGDADEVVQPAIALVIRLEPADKVLPSRLVAFKDRSPAKLDEDGRAILGGDQAAQVRQHATVRAPPWVVGPDNGALNPPGGGSTAFAVSDSLFAPVGAKDRVSGCLDADILVVAPMEN